jgi:iron complex outermembrane receptor protein
VTNPTAPYNYDKIRTFTQELRLQGTTLNDKLDFLVGGYYSNEKIEELQYLTLGSQYQASAAAGILGPLLGNNLSFIASDPLKAFTRLAKVVGFPAYLSPLNTVVDANGSFAQNLYNQNSRSWSIFTHNVLNITDQLSVTAGARYVHETKDGSFRQLSASSTACNTIANGYSNIITNLQGFPIGLPAATANLLAGAALGIYLLPVRGAGRYPGLGVPAATAHLRQAVQRPRTDLYWPDRVQADRTYAALRQL